MADETAIPPMQSVTSSNVEAVGHDAAANKLHVRFKNGGHYVYEGVDARGFQALLRAPSVGRHIANQIKGRYPVKRRDED